MSQIPIFMVSSFRGWTARSRVGCQIQRAETQVTHPRSIFDPCRAWETERERHYHPWAYEEIALHVTATGVKHPNRAASESVLAVHHDGKSNGEVFWIVRGEACLHAATIGQDLLREYYALDGNGCN